MLVVSERIAIELGSEDLILSLSLNRNQNALDNRLNHKSHQLIRRKIRSDTFRTAVL